MRFPRNAKLLRSPFDVAPFAAVFFLIVIFLLLSAFLPAPGLSLKLPQFDVSSLSEDLPGTDNPTVAVAIDFTNRLFFSSQLVTEKQLTQDLRRAVSGSKAPLTLVIQADQKVTYEELVRIVLLARDAGISNALLATHPRIVAAPNQP
ncbi:MAG TPA: biopolymer transporter ExbD [Verrucomicrobiae bacterium]|jgi:biopolymer transport protein ExbD|nr:biopolymer transporter ExbD [Verrucomicrobiae bacterium]